MTWLHELSTTGVRVVVTAIMCLGTAIRYWATGTAPDGEWLIFLGAMAGIDMTGVIGKRVTAKAEVITAEADASVKKIEATAAAVPPLTPTQAIEAGKVPDAVAPVTPKVDAPTMETE